VHATRNLRFRFQTGVELSQPRGDRPPSTRRTPTTRRRQIREFATPISTSAAEAKRIVSAWRDTIDIELDPDRVLKYLAALRAWRRRLNHEEKSWL
jgi:CRISPR/Cas system endoribonuclease Cas6 (RAMP superfamily)